VVSASRASVQSAPAIVRWPIGAEQRWERAGGGERSLLVVERGTRVPPLGPGEDWVWSDANEQEVARRLLDLGDRALPAAASAAVPLPAGLGEEQYQVAARLAAAAGVLVPRADLPSDDLDARIESLRAPMARAGWEILTVARVGFVLTQVTTSGTRAP